MASNSMGIIFRLTTFGESHGAAIGGVLDGCPAGHHIDRDHIATQMTRRRPGQSQITTQRQEADEVRFLSGVFEEKTTGAPIAFIIENEDQRPKDYGHLKDSFRPSHADMTFQKKYGLRDYRGGGRSSARVTAPIVTAGAIASQILRNMGVEIHAWVSRVQDIELKGFGHWTTERIESSIIRCPDSDTAQKMLKRIEEARREGDTVGGSVSCVVRGVPIGWGEPVFEKLNAALGKAMLGLNAVRSFELGSGIQGTFNKGSEENDLLSKTPEGIKALSNNSGGILGGISNGEDICFKVSFKPVATIMKDQDSVNDEGEATIIKGKGRHDPCVVPRAVPIVEALAALVLLDAQLLSQTSKI